MTRSPVLLSGVGLVSVVALTIAALSPREHLGGSPVLPARLWRLSLSRIFQEEEARTTLDMMHGRGVTPRENLIGLYGDGNASAILYCSSYPLPTDARGVELGMRQGIQSGRTPFGHYVDLRRAGQDVAMCFGLGQVHFIFSRGTILYWLAADPPIADSVLAGALSVITR